jgi:hypothetical protein
MVRMTFFVRYGDSSRLVGADYDLAQCTPADLDPHAVASIFKAYLREREFATVFKMVASLIHVHSP